MEATNYRIGNLVHGILEDGDGKRTNVVCRITAMDENGTLGDPISLTEEWLLKFGFEPNGVYASMRLPINNLTNDGNRSFIVITTGSIIEGWIEIIAKRGLSSNPTFIELQTDVINIKYVHQLQNLYFALTGEELLLKSSDRQAIDKT